jgi:hypothetical protein
MKRMETIPDAVLMQQYEIAFDGTKYHFREFVYGKLKDAVNYASKSWSVTVPPCWYICWYLLCLKSLMPARYQHNYQQSAGMSC